MKIEIEIWAIDKGFDIGDIIYSIDKELENYSSSFSVKEIKEV